MHRILLTFIAVISLSVLLFSCGPKDADVQSAVETSLKANSELSGLTASVKDGVVTLSGETKSESAKAQAEEITKSVKGVKNVINNSTVAAPPPPPVEPAPVITAADEALIKGVSDIIKDFPGVKADVKEGVIILTGEIKRASLQKLMPMLHSLNPKSIDNNKLTIK